MKAILFTQYGSPDALQFTEVEKPTPNDDQVLVKVVAASANPLDWHRMRGAPFLARLSEGFRKPDDPRLGADIGSGAGDRQVGKQHSGKRRQGGARLARGPAPIKARRAGGHLPRSVLTPGGRVGIVPALFRPR